VVKLAVDWEDRLDFVLAEDVSLKRLRLGEALLKDLDDGELEPAARLDAELALLGLQLRELIARLDAIFGLTPEEKPGESPVQEAPAGRAADASDENPSVTEAQPPWVE
jgi:recombination associated protein RdgC